MSETEKDHWVYCLEGRRYVYVGASWNPALRFRQHMNERWGVKRVGRYVHLCRLFGAPLPTSKVLFQYRHRDWPKAEAHVLRCYTNRGWRPLNINLNCTSSLLGLSQAKRSETAHRYGVPVLKKANSERTPEQRRENGRRGAIIVNAERGPKEIIEWGRKWAKTGYAAGVGSAPHSELSRFGRRAAMSTNHLRWHIRRGLHSESCPLCLSAASPITDGRSIA